MYKYKQNKTYNTGWGLHVSYGVVKGEPSNQNCLGTLEMVLMSSQFGDWKVYPLMVPLPVSLDELAYYGFLLKKG